MRLDAIDCHVTINNSELNIEKSDMICVDSTLEESYRRPFYFRTPTAYFYLHLLCVDFLFYTLT